MDYTIDYPMDCPVKAGSHVRRKHKCKRRSHVQRKRKHAEILGLWLTGARSKKTKTSVGPRNQCPQVDP